MSRLKKILKGINCKYSIGEVILIVTGILIAFGLNNWNENLKRKRYETAILEEIQTSLKNELKSIGDAIASYERGKYGNLICRLQGNTEKIETMDSSGR